MDKLLKRKRIAAAFTAAGVVLIIGSVGACEAEAYSLLHGACCTGAGFALVYAGRKIA